MPSAYSTNSPPTLAGKVTLQETLDILGVVRHDLLFEIVDLAREHDTQGALLFVERLSQGGTDYAQFIKDLLGHLRDVYVVRHTEETPASIAATEEQLQRLRSQAAQTPTDQVVALLDLLGEALRSIRQGSDPRLELELALIKFTALSGGSDPGPGATRCSARLRRPPWPRARQAGTVKPAASSGRRSRAGPEQAPQWPQSADPAPVPPERRRPPNRRVRRRPAAAVRPDIDHLKRAWPVVLEAVKKRQVGLAAVLGEGSPDSLDGDMLVIRFPAGYGFQAGQVARGQNPKVITEALQEVTGKPLRVSTKLADETEQKPAAAEEDARILSNDELIGMLKREFNAQVARR